MVILFLRSYTPSINDVSPFAYYSAREFAYHFQNHTFSPEEIINRLDLYSSNEFIKFIKTYPEYERKIKALYTEFNNLSNFKKIRYRLIGGYSSRLQTMMLVKLVLQKKKILQHSSLKGLMNINL